MISDGWVATFREMSDDIRWMGGYVQRDERWYQIDGWLRSERGVAKIRGRTGKMGGW
jgi:hypothetical protein